MTTQLPESHSDLLGRPLFAHLATLRPDGSPQSSVMWFDWDGRRVRFSHTSTRQKYRNLLRDGRVSFHVQDPENPYRTLEVRGRVESMDRDPTLCSTAPSRIAMA
jgi:PPOX class probable F420-dependent enzyme